MIYKIQANWEEIDLNSLFSTLGMQGESICFADSILYVNCIRDKIKLENTIQPIIGNYLLSSISETPISGNNTLKAWCDNIFQEVNRKAIEEQKIQDSQMNLKNVEAIYEWLENVQQELKKGGDANGGTREAKTRSRKTTQKGSD